MTELTSEGGWEAGAVMETVLFSDGTLYAHLKITEACVLFIKLRQTATVLTLLSMPWMLVHLRTSSNESQGQRSKARVKGDTIPMKREKKRSCLWPSGTGSSCFNSHLSHLTDADQSLALRTQ